MHIDKRLDKKSILKKTAQFGGITLLSRILGIIRDMLLARFLGIGIKSDAFIMAYRIPNFLRRIFAEGALSASFVPVFIRKVKNKELENPNGLMTISFLFFEGIVFLLCLFAILFPGLIFKLIAPGFSQEQLAYAIPSLRILFPLIFFISSSALLAGALNAVNHFFVPALCPALLNVVWISALSISIKFNLSIKFLCYSILFGGFLNFLVHLIVYLKYNFSFGFIDRQAKDAFKLILSKFVPSLLGVSVIEINLLIDTFIGSFLPSGSVSILYFAGLFVNMPIGIFAVGFATVLLSQFSRVVVYAPKRINFYILEVTKFITWLIMPIMLFLMFVSEAIFSILMLGKKARFHDIFTAKWVLIVFSVGLVFFCLNKILVNIFYSLHDTKSPTIALVFSTIVNFLGNLIGIKLWGIFGIAGSTAFSAAVLTFLLIKFLHKKHNFKFYSPSFFNFLGRYLVQLLIASLIFLISYFTFFRFLQDSNWYNFFYASWGYWFIVFPLAAICAAFLFFTKKLFGIKLYFLGK
ncbi:murein biosynthesis integral membrane protein MurJ [Candidatus Babeliales bacterium]|nr:murein biosynthesis integral membrane protein MurJ [Candidatus Babeliales bacterium]MCF7899806.1 murein biosynthesis integral membrane protein MurJ [Candidatus Babeliales bacterium]